MSKPTGHHNKHRRGNRRSHHALKPTQTAACPKCKSPIISHRVCQTCGQYNGRVVVNKQAAVEKALEKTAAAKKGAEEPEK